MKNRILSFLTACILIVIPCVSGCSPKDESDKSISKAEREKVTNVFKTNWLEIPESYSVSSNSVVLSNDRIYMLGYEQSKISVEDEESASWHTAMISCDMDGKDVQIGEVPYEKIDKFDILSDGSMIFLLRFFDEETWYSEYWLNKVDTSGNEVFSVNMTDMISQLPGSGMYTFMGDIQIDNMAVDAEDRIYLQTASTIVAVSPGTGKILFDVTADAVNQMLRVGNKVAVQYRDGEGVFRYIDPDAKKMGDDVFIPDKVSIENYTVYSAYGGNDSGLLYCYKTPVGLCSVSQPGSGIGGNEILNWLNSDISPNQSGTMMILSNDKVFYTERDLFSSNNGYIAAVLTRVPEDQVIPKYVIEVAYVNRGILENEVFDIAMKFNQYNENYRVIFTDYNQFSGGVYGDELRLFINTQIASGNIPDLFLLDSYFLTGNNYEDKGLFYDLYQYLDSDPELGRDKFLKCVLPAGEFDGKLYKLIHTFSVSTLVGKTENVGDLRGWSISDFLDIAENRSDSVKMIQKETRSNVFDSIIRSGLNEFIDYESGTCSFNSDLFLRLLNYLRRLPDESSEQYSGEMLQKELRENTSLLEKINIYTFSSYVRRRIDFGAEDLTFVGFPGGGEKIEFRGAYAISAKSEKEIRDGAWEFIKYIFTSPYKQDIYTMNAFPSTYASFHKFAETEMKYYYIISSNGTSGSLNEYTQEEIDRRGGVQVKITQEDVDEVLAYLDSIEKSDAVDSKIYEIIDEEMQYFFADAKSAEETANLIQSRVSIYLSESK